MPTQEQIRALVQQALITVTGLVEVARTEHPETALSRVMVQRGRSIRETLEQLEALAAADAPPASGAAQGRALDAKLTEAIASRIDSIRNCGNRSISCNVCEHQLKTIQCDVDRLRALDGTQEQKEQEATRVDGFPDGAHGDLPRPAEGRRER